MKAISCLFHRRAGALPPPAKVTSTKLLTEPAQASISLSTVKDPKHMTNPASQSSTFWLFWNSAQEHRGQKQKNNITLPTHTQLTFPCS